MPQLRECGWVDTLKQALLTGLVASSRQAESHRNRNHNFKGYTLAMKRVLLTLLALGLAQNGYCGWKDALKEVAKQAIDQASQPQSDVPPSQRGSGESRSEASQQKSAEELKQEQQERQDILFIEQNYPRNWVTQFRMVQYGFNPEDKDATEKLIALEKLALPAVQVDEYTPAKLGEGMPFSGVMAIFGVDQKDQERTKDLISWLKYRWKPVFLQSCTASYQLTKKLDFNGIDDLSTKQKLEYVSKVHYKVSDSSPYLMDISPIKGKVIQKSAVDVERAYQGFQGSKRDESEVAKVDQLVQARALDKKKKEEKIRKIEALSRKSGKPDVDVTIGANQFHGTLTFDIQATANQVKIWKVSVNRGSCELPEGTATDIDRTIDLKFGQTYRGYSNNCQMKNVREIEVITESGKFVFKFQ